MRHGLAGNRLGRNSTLRKATMRDVAKATLIRQRITTTLPIAKEARKYVDRLVTLGKKGTLAHKRQAFAILLDHDLVSDLFNKIAPRFKSRAGGYTRIIPLSHRRGDNARMAFLELTEKEEVVVVSKPKTGSVKKAKTVDTEASTQTAEEKKKPEPAKPAAQKHLPTEDKPKVKPKMGMIKKMFQRKVGGE